MPINSDNTNVDTAMLMSTKINAYPTIRAPDFTKLTIWCIFGSGWFILNYFWLKLWCACCLIGSVSTK